MSVKKEIINKSEYIKTCINKYNYTKETEFFPYTNKKDYKVFMCDFLTNLICILLTPTFREVADNELSINSARANAGRD